MAQKEISVTITIKTGPPAPELMGGYLATVMNRVGAARYGRKKEPKEPDPNRKQSVRLGYDEAMRIRHRIAAGATIYALAKEYGCDRWSIQAIWVNKSYPMSEADYRPELEAPNAREIREREAANERRRAAERKAKRAAMLEAQNAVY